MSSRVARKPVELPKGVQVEITQNEITVKGQKGALKHSIPTTLNVVLVENRVDFSVKDGAVNADAIAGTIRSLVNNMVQGVSQGYEIKLVLVGVGYRAQVKGAFLGLTLGFSHPVDFPIPQGITIETPSQTEIVIKGIDKQLVGETAAKIRAYRPPEPYKGKGIRYSNEIVKKKETKKK